MLSGRGYGKLPFSTNVSLYFEHGTTVEQNRCKDRASRKAITLESPRTGVIAHVHPETSISKQQTHHMACFYSVCKEDQCARQCHMLLLSPERRRQSLGSAGIHFR